MVASLSDYMTSLFGGEDDFLRSIREEAAEAGLPAIQIPLEVGRLLTVLIQATGTRKVLEIGTLFGYSSIIMARALPADGRIITLEVEPRHASLAEANFSRAGVAGKIELRLGPALESLEQLRGQSFDLVLIDADKPSYPQYLEWTLQLVHPGSVIVADNVWRGGSVADPDSKDETSREMPRFNRLVAENPRLASAIVPTRAGEDAVMVSVVRREDGSH